MGISIYVNDTTQAGRVIKKFGNARRLAAIMAMVTKKPCDPSRIYRWMRPRDEGGTGGLVPSSAMEDVLKCARLEGIVFSPEELLPTPLAPVGEDFSEDKTEAA